MNHSGSVLACSTRVRFVLQHRLLVDQYGGHSSPLSTVGPMYLRASGQLYTGSVLYRGSFCVI